MEFSLPLVNAKLGNNGIMFYGREEDFDSAEMTIDIISNGAVATGTVYPQIKKVGVLWDAYLIKFKKEILPEHLIFISSALEKSIKLRFGWENKAVWTKVRREFFELPTINGKIAFSYMENYIKTLEAERIETLEAYLTVTGLKEYHLTKNDEKILDRFAKLSDTESRVEEWGSYNLLRLYGASTRGKRLKSADRYVGHLPFVTAGEDQTGISGYIGNEVEVFEPHTITIDMFGSAKYRGYAYGADDHVAVVHTEHLQRHSSMFVATCIHSVSSSGQFSYARNFYAKDADELNISLPTLNNQPDYTFMSDFIKVIEKLVIKDLVEWTDKKIQATKEVVAQH